VTVLLADHNVERHARLLFAALQALEWAQLLNIRLANFSELGLVETSTDREVWRRTQQLGMLLLTNNPTMKAPTRVNKHFATSARTDHCRYSPWATPDG
jgi:hypothetical protein